MCLGRVGGVVGVVGAALIFLGLLQVVSGTYFMLALPIFQLGSNLWTGAWSSVCGLVVGVLAWRGKALQRGQVVLVATLSVLVANVANLVILQVGEQGVFLTPDNWRTIVGKNQENQLKIALWLTTVLSGLGIGVSFLGAQYLFCAVVRGPRVKGRMPVTRSLSDQDLQRRQVLQMTRFPSAGMRNGGVVPDSPPSEAAAGGDGGGGEAVHGLSGGGGGGDGSGGSGSGGGEGGGSGGGGGYENTNGPKTSPPGTPEGVVPYFLRNHKSAWQFILPAVVTEETLPDSSSRCSTLSRASRSSFQPYRPSNMEPYNPGPTPPQLHAPILRVPRASSSRPSSRPSSHLSSSCSASLYSIHEGSRSDSPARRGTGKVVRPSVPPPAPPTSAPASDTLRSHPVGGWESCAVIQYPAQAGGGFVVDLD